MEKLNVEEAKKNLSLDKLPAQIVKRARENVIKDTNQLLDESLKREIDSMSNILIDNVYPIVGLSRVNLLTSIIGLMNLKTSINTSNIVDEYIRIFEEIEIIDTTVKKDCLKIESTACRLLMDLTMIINVHEYQQQLIPFYTDNAKRINKVFSQYIDWNLPLATNNFIIHYVVHARWYNILLRPGLEHLLSKFVDLFTSSLAHLDENITNYRGIREKHNILQLQMNREFSLHYDRNFLKVSTMQRTLLGMAYFFILDIFHSIPSAQAILYYVRRMNRRRESICYLLYRQLRPLILNLKGLQLRAEQLSRTSGRKQYNSSEWENIYEKLFYEILKRCTDINKFIKANAIDFMLWLKESCDKIPDIDDDFIRNLEYLQPGSLPEISPRNHTANREKVSEKVNSTINLGDFDISMNLSDLREKVFDQNEENLINEESLKSFTETDV